MRWTIFILAFMVSSKVKADCPPEEWGYEDSNGPSMSSCWPYRCQTGTKQSPIDIPHHNATVVKHWLPFHWIDYHEDYKNVTIKNDGTSAIINIGRDCRRPRVKNGGLGDDNHYELDHIRIHWGSKHNRGSEHTIHGDRYSAEVQFVHINEKCGREVEEAFQVCAYNANSSPEDIFAIFSVFLEVGDEPNWAYEHIFDAVDHIRHPGASTWVQPMELANLYPEDKHHFYRYMGSLTIPFHTPPTSRISCGEFVSWTVFKDPVRVSYSQLSRLWRLKTDRSVEVEHLTNNYRPVQPLNDRDVIFADLHLKCDYKGWKVSETCHFNYKEEESKMGFLDSFHGCIHDAQHGETGRLGLITVGMLRCLRNNFGYGLVAKRNEHNICGRFFRVNAIKNTRGEWREYGSGNWVPLHHFPDFDPTNGHDGDTLIWDAFVNRIFVADDKEMYMSMCFKEFEKKCHNCVGHHVGHECADSGDCWDSTCQCDSGFSSNQCLVPPLPSKDVVIFGTIQNPYDFRMNTKQSTDYIPIIFCELPSYTNLNPTAEVEMFCDFIFGRAFCCGGHQHPTNNQGGTLVLPNTNICGYLDCHHHKWEPIHDFPTPLYWEAAAVVKKDGEDYAWIASGGQADVYPPMQDRMYIMKHDLRWETLMTVIPEPRAGHCSLQISDCEIALIGGGQLVEHSGNTVPTCTADSTTSQIDIYNFKTNMWRQGPLLPDPVLIPGCARIRDRITNDLQVVFGCDCLTSSVYLWDITKDEIVLTDHECPESDFTGPMKFKALDDQNIVVTNSISARNYAFDIVNGFRELAFGVTSQYEGDSAVAPAGTYQCESILTDD